MKLSLPLLPLVLAMTTALASGCAHEHHAHDDAHHRFENATEWSQTFEDPARDAWQKPDQVIQALALRQDARVADIGSATGYFPVRIARAVPQGQVIGSDIEPSMVEYLAQRARKEGLANLQAVLATPDDPKIPGPVDLILVVDTYHHLEDRPAYFRRLAPLLGKEGRLAIIDFRPDSSKGPQEKLASQVVIEELAQAGYSLIQQHGFLPEQYFLELRPAR